MALVAALVAAGPGPARAAEPPITIETVRIGFGTQDQYEVGSWTPVWVDLKAGRGRFQGRLEVVVADDDGTPTAIRRDVDVAGRRHGDRRDVRPPRPVQRGIHDQRLRGRLAPAAGLEAPSCRAARRAAGRSARGRPCC